MDENTHGSTPLSFCARFSIPTDRFRLGLSHRVGAQESRKDVDRAIETNDGEMSSCVQVLCLRLHRKELESWISDVSRSNRASVDLQFDILRTVGFQIVFSRYCLFAEVYYFYSSRGLSAVL